MTAAHGELRLVGTPIGNLEDISVRAVESLRSADLILAEDTRRTRTLCTAHDIRVPLRAFHAYSDQRVIEKVIAEIEGGARIALVTDAGMPAVSDPGAELVAAVAAAGLRTTVVPGPSALTSIMALAGLGGNGIRFIGFLPRKGRGRNDAIDRLAVDDSATVFFETAPRIGKTLADIASRVEGNRQACVGRELTKLHEEIRRGPIGELAKHFAASSVKGELTVFVEGSRAPKRETVDLDERIREMLAEEKGAREIAIQLAREHSLPRKEIYARVLHAKGET